MPLHRSARSLRTIVATILIVCACALGSASTASAAPLACGDTITTSVTLTADLVCQGNGLTILGDSITVNLNGHTIKGPGAATSTTGISVSGQFLSPPLIENGTIREFGLGVEVQSDMSAQVINLRVARNGVGILVNLGQLTVNRSYINENLGDGIFMVLCFGVNGIYDSQIGRNGGNGITDHECLLNAAGNVISGNRGYGIWNENFGVDLRNNKVIGNGLDGIFLDQNPFNDSYTLLNNTANQNGGHGIVFNAHPVAQEDSLDQFEGNVADQNLTNPQCMNIFCRTS